RAQADPRFGLTEAETIWWPSVIECLLMDMRKRDILKRKSHGHAGPQFWSLFQRKSNETLVPVFFGTTPGVLRAVLYRWRGVCRRKRQIWRTIDVPTCARWQARLYD